VIKMDERTRENLIIASVIAGGTFLITYMALQYKFSVENQIRKLVK